VVVEEVVNTWSQWSRQVGSRVWEPKAMLKPTATRQMVVTHPGGVHARPSLAILNTVRRFRSEVRIRYNHTEADASAILELLSLGIPHGAEVTLTARGPDADEVLDALEKLFADNFGIYGE
jgi:phosphotransferase system HPr (HPr) family protein